VEESTTLIQKNEVRMIFLKKNERPCIHKIVQVMELMSVSITVEKSNKSSRCQWEKSYQFTRQFCRHFWMRCLNIKNGCYGSRTIITTIIVSIAIVLAIGILLYVTPHSIVSLGHWVCSSRGEIFLYNNVTNQTEYLRPYGWKYMVTSERNRDICQRDEIEVALITIVISIVIILVNMTTTSAFYGITFRVGDVDDEIVITESNHWEVITVVLSVIHVLIMVSVLDRPFTANIVLAITYIISIVPICLTIYELVVFVLDIKIKHGNRYIQLCTQGMIIRSLICLLIVSIMFIFFNYITPLIANRACHLHDSWRFLEVIAKIDDKMCHHEPNIPDICMLAFVFAIISFVVSVGITALYELLFVGNQECLSEPRLNILLTMCIVIGFMFYGFFVKHYVIGIMWIFSPSLVDMLCRGVLYFVCGSVRDTVVGMDKKYDNV
jgi:hypothetical protein